MQVRNSSVIMKWSPPKSHNIWSARFACLTIMSSTPCGCCRWGHDAYTGFFLSVFTASEGLSQGVQTTFNWFLAWQWAGLLKWQICTCWQPITAHTFLMPSVLDVPLLTTWGKTIWVEAWCNACPAGCYHSSDDCVSYRSDVHKTAWGMWWQDAQQFTVRGVLTALHGSKAHQRHATIQQCMAPGLIHS